MKRTIIPQDRKKLKHEDISLNIKEEENSLKVEVKLTIEKDDYPQNAKIILEAYNRVNMHRIELDRVQNYEDEKQVFDLPFSTHIRAKINFRLKIINPENYKLLGYAEKLKEEKYVKSLLVINDKDDKVTNIFQIDFENEDNPILYLNPRLSSVIDKLKPIIAEMAFKDILTYLLNNEDRIENFEEHKWFKFADGLVPRQDKDGHKEDNENWIKQVLCKFSEENKVIEPIEKIFKEND